ncbi:hypothetical protein IFM89_008207 [Coptis chinensis]|uniref:C3H1-type domain-containing protein n=1 Tax=Coptis chinensis TaxID=261450 RepID=A0A835GZX1_9MAGN|nr:hypothetical protein IFM89_008207 [Coptis chinensis]
MTSSDSSEQENSYALKQDEEEPEEEEPEEEEEVPEEESILDTQSEANNNYDSSPEVESEGHDKDLRLEKSKGSLVSHRYDEEDSGSYYDSPYPSNDALETQVMELARVGKGDSKTETLSKNKVVYEAKRSEESISGNKGATSEPLKRTPIEACKSAQKQYGESHCGTQDHSISTFTGAKKTKSAFVGKKKGASEILMRDGSANKVVNRSSCSKKENKLMDMQSGENVKLKASSSLTPKIRPRSLSPPIESEDGTKRPAIICDFFARGWCIKGSSCKFLHRKDGMDNTSMFSNQDVPTKSSNDNFKDSGLRVENEKSSVQKSKPLASSESQRSRQSVDKHDKHCSLVPDDLKSDNPGSGWQHLGSASGFQCKSNNSEEYNRSLGIPLLNEIRNHHSHFMDDKRLNGEEYVRGYSSSMTNLLPEHRFLSSGSPIPSSVYRNSSSSLAYEKSIGEPPNLILESQSMKYVARTSSGFISSPISSFITSFPSRSSSMLGHSPSTFYSRPEQEILSLHRSTGHHFRSTISNWEPSVPFRPSFHISSIMSSPKNQYDPLLDSIDPPNGGERTVWGSSVSQSATTHNTSNQQANGDPISFHQKPQYGLSENSVSSHGVDGFTTPADVTATFGAQQQNNRSLSKEENRLKSGRFLNSTNAKDVDLDHKHSHQGDGGNHTKESKALKLFRASLIEFVKELVKPYWREGHLSKDAHNTIVKKAVEKVLHSLQPQQIPNTTESTTEYLSASQPKLAKLVEGYVGRESVGLIVLSGEVFLRMLPLVACSGRMITVQLYKDYSTTLQGGLLLQNPTSLVLWLTMCPAPLKHHFHRGESRAYSPILEMASGEGF